jgi:dTDP-4-amino-4,6-dideoxygalactose transaminase
MASFRLDRQSAPHVGEHADLSREPATDFIRFGAPCIGEEEIDEVVSTLRSGWLGTGPKTHQFELQFANLVRSRFALGTNSGTAALHLGLNALGVGPGDEVITTPLTFVATANVIEHCGATPVFCDVRPEDGNLDPELVDELVTDRTKAILPVHYAGALADTRGLRDRFPDHPILVDAAHAVEARTDTETSAGGAANATAYSFYVTKNLCTGEGGMLVTDDEAIARCASVRRLHGLDNDAWARYSSTGYREYELVYPGFKYNMTDIQASIGIHQLAKLDAMSERRAEIWTRYNEAFDSLPGIMVPPISLLPPESREHARHLYTLWFDWDAIGFTREALVMQLRAAGIGTGWHFRPVHLHWYYRERYGLEEGNFPVAEWIGNQTVSIPLSAALQDNEVERVIASVTALVTHRA